MSTANASNRRKRIEEHLEPLLVSHPHARKLLDVGNTKYWDLVKAGDIEVRDVGKRSMATYRSIKRLAGV